MAQRNSIRSAAVALLALAVVAVVAGCASTDTRHPAVIAMEEVLQLRRAASTDATAYAPYFLESSVATALAESGETTGSPVPEWQEPYVSSETSSTADVVVVWVADDDHPDWPEATVFVFEASDGEWRIADALDVDDELPEPLDTVDE